jgi:Integrase core domain
MNFAGPTIEQVKAITDKWLTQYNEYRPHDALGGQPPRLFMPRLTTQPAADHSFAVSTRRGSLSGDHLIEQIQPEGKFPISRWLSQNKEKFDVDFFKILDTKEWLPGVSDCCVYLRFRGIEVFGNAFSFETDLALEKASAEAIERLCMHFTKIKISNGLAAHTDFQSASEQATRELFERDSYMCHILTRTPFLADSIGTSTLKKTVLFPFREKLLTVGITVELKRMRTANGERGYVCIALGEKYKKPFGFVLGLGLSETDTESINHACFECYSQLAKIFYGPRQKSLTRRQFEMLEKPSLNDHYRVGLNKSAALEFRETYLSTASKRAVEPGRLISDSPKVSISRIQLPKDFRDCPIVIAQAKSKDLQMIYVGVGSNLHLNFKRLRNFSQSETIPDPIPIHHLA